MPFKFTAQYTCTVVTEVWADTEEQARKMIENRTVATCDIGGDIDREWIIEGYIRPLAEIKLESWYEA
jgi:hypothetical protein